MPYLSVRFACLTKVLATFVFLPGMTGPPHDLQFRLRSQTPFLFPLRLL